MAPRLPNWFLGVARFGKLLAVVLALAGQINSGALAAPRPPSETAVAALRAAMVLCLATNHKSKDGLPPIHHHLPGLAIAAEAHHFGQHAAILGGARFLPPPPLLLACWTGLPEARGPPARFDAACYPTGPPRLI